MTLSGRVALVTGASQGIGRACALRLAQSGATLALAARNQEKLHQLAGEIEAAGGKAAGNTLNRQGRSVTDGQVLDPEFAAVRAGHASAQ